MIREYVASNISSWNEKYPTDKYNLTETPKVVFSFIYNSVTIA
jgi:hypothetical protein